MIFETLRWLLVPMRFEFGGGGGGTQTVEKSADPWAGQQPYLREIFAQAQRQFQRPGPFFFPSQTVAPFDPTTIAAQQALVGGAGTAGQIGQTAAGALQFNLTGARDVASNPYLQSAIAAATEPIYRRLTEAGGGLSQVSDEAIAAGQFGGTRQGIAEGIVRARANEDAARIAAEMASRGYETGLEAATRGLALTPQIQQAQATEAQLLDVVGQQRRQLAQELIDEAIARWNFEQNRDVQKLANYQQFVQGAFGGAATSTSPAARVSPLLSAAGGALAGASIGAQFGSAGGPWGAGIGALLGLFGAFG